MGFNFNYAVSKSFQIDLQLLNPHEIVIYVGRKFQWRSEN